MARWAIGLLTLAFTGCSSFNREWKRSALAPAPTNDIAGQWSGRWLSHANGHNGELRCIMTPHGETQYSARFHAKYRKLITLSATYTVPLTVVQTNGRFSFQGSADLGWLSGGVYTYYGSATATNFESSYSSKADHGVFEMTRPPLHPQ